MKPRKEFLLGSLLVWLMLLPFPKALHAAGCPDFGCAVHGETDSTGFFVDQWGGGSAIAGKSYSSAPLSYGVLGSASNGTGVYGDSLNGDGVFGYSLAATGVLGRTYGQQKAGVQGENEGSGGAGVYGYAKAGIGVFGQTELADSAGVQGEHSAVGVGVAGISALGTGIMGEGQLNGVYGMSHSADHAGGLFENDAQGWGVWAETNSPLSANRPTIAGFNLGSGYGLHGESKQGTGVIARGLKRGIQGVATVTKTKGTGVFGSAAGSAGVGVEGSCNKGKGIQGTTETGAGVYGVATEKGWAGKFQGYKDASGVLIATNGGPGLVVSGGSKSAVVPTSQGSRLLYAEEAAEVYFSDYGSGRLQDGKAVIPIDPLFAETVNLGQPYHVFVQPYSDAQLVVSRRTSQEFEVRLHARDTEGDRNAEFSYRLVAKRKGFEQARLEQSSYADGAEKRMDTTAPEMSDRQAFLTLPEAADLPEPARPPGPPPSLRQHAMRWGSLGNGK